MKIQLIRNASLKIVYSGQVILFDPMLCKKETMEPFVPGLEKNPTVDLPLSIEDILDNIDAVMVTHSHPDHFDTVSSEHLKKDIPILITPTDKDFFEKQNFTNLIAIDTNDVWSDIKITRIEGQHGSGSVLPYMGEVSGFILQAQDEPTVYLLSDTILTETIKNVIAEFKPEVIIANVGGGVFPGVEDYPVMLDEKQAIQIAQLAPFSTIVAVHLESIDFCRVTRKSLREFANASSISEEQLIIPDDGEVLHF